MIGLIHVNNATNSYMQSECGKNHMNKQALIVDNVAKKDFMGEGELFQAKKKKYRKSKSCVHLFRSTDPKSGFYKVRYGGGARIWGGVPLLSFALCFCLPFEILLVSPQKDSGQLSLNLLLLNYLLFK